MLTSDNSDHSSSSSAADGAQVPCRGIGSLVKHADQVHGRDVLSPVVWLIRRLHTAAEVLQVKAHNVVQAVNPPQAGIQLVPRHLHLLPAIIKQH